MMRLDHISVSLPPNQPDETYFIIKAELKGVPGKQWQDGLRFVWYNSPYYICKKSELEIEGDEIVLYLEGSTDLQKAIDALSSSIMKADKMVKNTGISYISSFRNVMG